MVIGQAVTVGAIMLVHFKTPAIVTIQPVISSYPYKSSAVFKNAPDSVAAQTVFGSKPCETEIRKILSKNWTSPGK